MATKEELVDNIKEWMLVDTEMKVLQRELKQRRERKKMLTESLVCIMKDNEIDCFDISEGKILYTKNRVKAPISKRHLVECLSKYFQENPTIEGDDVSKFILDSRETKLKETIRHKLPKNIS
jgi:hypothetical protein